jgi:hypothetical protein
VTLTVAQAIQQRMWKEVVINYFEVRFRHLPREAEKNNAKHTRIVSFQTEILTLDLPYMKQECYPLDHNVQKKCVESHLHLS